MNTRLQYLRLYSVNKTCFLLYIFLTSIYVNTSFLLAQTLNAFTPAYATFPISNCEAALQPPSLINIPNQELIADTAITTEDGWTHFYNCAAEKLLLSIYTQEQNIGTIENGIIVKSGTKSNYGNAGIDLSSASYIDNELWFAANRYWSVSELAVPVDSLQIRFYIDNTDYQDLVASFADLPGDINHLEELNPFAITGQADNPYLLELDLGFNEAIIYGHDTALIERRDWIDGVLSELYYSEFVVKNAFLPPFSEASGSIGFLFFLPDTPLSVAGQFLNVHGEAVDVVEVSCGADVGANSNSFGQYQCTGLTNGEDVTVTAEKEDIYAKNVTVLDVNRLWAHLLAIPSFASPYSIIAADLDSSEGITANDELLMRRLILQKDTELNAVPAWRFIPKAYAFPNPLLPFSPAFPQQIDIENILFDVFNQDFVGIKAGDVADEGDYPNIPALIVTPGFRLSDNEVMCGDDAMITTELSVQDFTELTGFQFSLQWDTSRLDLMGVDEFNLLGFSEENINLELIDRGQLTFAWTSLPMALDGVSKANGDVICKLHFRLKSTNMGNTAVNFSHQPTPIQILRKNWSVVETPIFGIGLISIEGSNVAASLNNIQSVTCFGETDGAIDITVNEGTPPYSYLWSNGETTEDLNEIGAGNYHVTVEDAGNCPFVLTNLQVTQPNVLNIIADIERPDCNDFNSGMITAMPMGGTSPYEYEWEDGSSLPTLTNLSGGTYGLTVTDDQGCQAENTFSVPNGGMLTASVMIQGVSSPSTNNGQICITNVFFGASPFTYLWSNGVTSACNENLALGNYRVTVTDANGCQNNFAYEVSCCVITDLDEVESADYAITLKPNPVSVEQEIQLDIIVPQAQSLNIRVLDLAGRVLSQEQVLVSTQENIMIKSPNIKGVYLVEILSEAGWRKVEKVAVW